MSRLESWVTSNWLTQGYGLHFEDLSIVQLEQLESLAIEERAKKIDQNAQQKQLKEELEIAEEIVSKLKEKLENN